MAKSSAAKKTKAPKKSAAAPSHPPYKTMIEKAICDLKERGGSSRVAIVKYIATNYKVGETNPLLVKQAIRRMVANELVHASSKSQGANGSFKLAPEEARTAKPKKKVSPTKKASPVKSKSPQKPKAKSAAKPKAPKKSTKKAAAKK